MEHDKTKALRPVSKKVNECLGDIPRGSFNFGLYFNKWFCVVDKDSNGDSWKRGDQWNCSLSDLTEVAGNHGDDCCHPNIQLENLAMSLALFNGQNSIRRETPVMRKKWGKKLTEISTNSVWRNRSATDLLKSKHENLDNIAKSYASLGYESLFYEATLLSSLVIGLGNEHPTEKGFLFDWNIGIPYIPASSIKGVVRLAAMVNKLNEFYDPNASDLLSYLDNIKKDDTMPQPMKDLFGTGGDKSSQRGKVIFLDAYPKSLPKLKAEIMNCHYPDYLNKAERGPTEDQSPNPQKYWAVDRLNRSGEPLKFIFRMIIYPDVANNHFYLMAIEDAVLAALRDHGLGAKTAVGHGRFIVSQNDDESNDLPTNGSSVSVTGPTHHNKPISQPETWKGATLTWYPGPREVIAQLGTKKASTKDRSLVPETMKKKLFEKKKPVLGDVEVDGSFKITKIE